MKDVTKSKVNQYLEIKTRHQKELDNFPMFFAFSDKQFEEGMKKFGLSSKDANKIYSTSGGGFIKKTDSKKLKYLFAIHNLEMKEAIESDKTGEGFIFDMFDYELSNHEYCITMSVEDTLYALGLTIEEINKNPALIKGLRLAERNQFDSENY